MNHLLQINLGPVQGFIATARRSRDLWFGSYILSELSKAVALALHQAGARLIFPCVNNLDEQLQRDSELLVTNIVFAELQADDLAAARAVIDRAQQAALDRWQSLCDQALRQIEKERDTCQPGQEPLHDEHIWHTQLGDVVEVYSGVVPVGSDGYAQANNRLRELLANRKNTRSFTPYSDSFHRPKSSLDGAQSSVLRDSKDKHHKRLRHRLGIEPTEQLDTAAMVKRVVGRERGFVPAARVAAHGWIQKASTDKPAFDTLQLQLSRLEKVHQGTRLGKRYTEYPWIATLPFDGQLLYRFRLSAEAERLKDDNSEEGEEAKRLLKELDVTLSNLYCTHGAPNPYYGLLLADGDKMGQLIDKANEKAKNGDGHRAISQALSAFAQRVPELMSQHEGACIYSGGDDVLGLVPLHKAIETAQDLRRRFAQDLRQVALDNGLPEAEHPTLSVGIALVHFLQPLGDARQLASKAEKTAKGSELPQPEQRNALCLLAQPRSGEDIKARIRWNEPEALDRLQDWTQQLRDGLIPRGLPHEVDAAYKRCLKAFNDLDATNFKDFKAYWQAHLNAVLDKKKSQGEGLEKNLKADLLRDLSGDSLTLENAKNFPPLQHLLMARWLSGQTTGDDE